MDTPPPPPSQKKGLGVLGWLGIGCGSIIVLAVIGVIAFSVLFGGKIKEMAKSATDNPTRFAATTMVTVGQGHFEIIAEDDVNKRYTVRQKDNNELTTVYWDEKKKSVETVKGDFSAIPAADSTPSLPDPQPVPQEKPAPAQ